MWRGATRLRNAFPSAPRHLLVQPAGLVARPASRGPGRASQRRSCLVLRRRPKRLRQNSAGIFRSVAGRARTGVVAGRFDGQGRSGGRRLERILAWKGAVTVSLKKSIAVAIIALAIPLVYLATGRSPGRPQPAIAASCAGSAVNTQHKSSGRPFGAGA